MEWDDWPGGWALPGLLLQGLVLGSVFCPEHPDVTGSRKLSIATGLFCHLHGTFWKCDIISGRSPKHVARAKWDEESQSWSTSPRSPRPSLLGTQTVAEPSGRPALQRCGEGWVLGPSLRGKHHVSCSLDTPRLAPTSKGLLFLFIHKAILSYQKFGLIYIHTHIYQHLYLYNASTVLGILQPQHMPFLSTSFG